MLIKKAELLAVAVRAEQYPAEGPPEIAFAGRSNVGKSSLLNLLAGQRKLARISGSPGKTRTINFYTVNGDAFRIVDLPGYGYAKVSKSETERWGDMIETYLKNRKRLKKVALLVDIRHEPSAQDRQMYDWLRYYDLDGLVVATKSDKVSKGSMAKHLKVIAESLGIEDGGVLLPISVLKRTGLAPLTAEIAKQV
ncbi:MAG: ribosome biogenesis GTP-binding protein YihA/YsxC [Clostridiales Family XIII bacterium]|jgi:GTP-binding protein|nr:ribosome biogenesis GTP-binding protein YihA/YsxC [Clostridiales Family XIII bacterium]